MGIGSLCAVTGMLALAGGAAMAAASGRKSFGRLVDFVSRSQQHRLRQCFPRFARALRPRRAARVIGNDHRRFLFASLHREQSRCLERRVLKKVAATQFRFLHSALAVTAGVIFRVAGCLFRHLPAPGDTESR